ncbi:MAG: hypothetical protein IPN65_03315, partial [Elusimicrobia bacterium]|nr:hypothetical protein [Elusimicrobiota bacterium]
MLHQGFVIDPAAFRGETQGAGRLFKIGQVVGHARDALLFPQFDERRRPPFDKPEIDETHPPIQEKVIARVRIGVEDPEAVGRKGRQLENRGPRLILFRLRRRLLEPIVGHAVHKIHRQQAR